MFVCHTVDNKLKSSIKNRQFGSVCNMTFRNFGVKKQFFQHTPTRSENKMFSDSAMKIQAII